LLLSPTACLQPMHTTSLTLLGSLPLCFHIYWPLQGANLVTLLLSPIGSCWLSERANGNRWVGFQGPLCFCIILHFCRPCTLLAACFMLVSCLAYSSALKIGATCSSKMSRDSSVKYMAL
jgi:hypothetical protein